MVLCTASKGRSLKSCIVLVAFCCSLVVACISPVFADTTSGSRDSFALYASFSGGPVDTYASKPMVIPSTGSHVFLAMSPKTSVSVDLVVSAPQIIPADFDRTLILNIGLQGNRNISVTDQGRMPILWYQSSRNPIQLDRASRFLYSDVIGSGAVGKQLVVSIIIPGSATAFKTYGFPALFKFTGDGSSVGITSFGGYIVDSADEAVVDVVRDILTQVTEINSKSGESVDALHSAVNALNSILRECKDINADTDNIISILRAVNDKLISLNGRVDDIYTLLKDSLKAESDAIDQKSQQVGEQILQRVDSEQYWEDKNTENFNALDMGSWTFGDGVVGALPTVSNLFKGLWDSCGDVVLIFTFPLMLGLALVIIGRISRHSGKGGKSGGDSG